MTNFEILIFELSGNRSNLLAIHLEKLHYTPTVVQDPLVGYELLRMKNIDIVIMNCAQSGDFEYDTIRDIQNLSDAGIVFLTPDYDMEKMERFSSFHLLAYKIKLANILSIIKDIDTLLQRLIKNAHEVILLVKGKSETRDLLQELLRLRRYEVVLCPNGASAWKKLDKIDRISLLLIDTNITDMEGIDIVKKAKRLFGTNLPIISVSRKCDPFLLQENISNGINDFIKVPVIPLEFTLKIDLWIDNLKQQREINQKNKEIEKTLRGFEALANATIEALLMFENNICVDANDEALVRFGYPTKAMMRGIHILDFLPQSISKYDLELLFDSSVNHEFNIDMVRSDKKMFPAHIKERNISLENKELKVIAIMDLTEIRRSEEMLHQQSKMASMGEMMQNIAHQWRQPLSSITVSASSILLSQQIGMLEEGEIEEQLGEIIESAAFLSQTIEDFQNFLKNNKKISLFVLQDTIDKVIKLIDGNLKKHKIRLIKEYGEMILVTGLESELMQILLNVINNAKDTIVEREIQSEERNIWIRVNLLGEKIVHIEIQDGAKGIAPHNIEKLFEPYFTTKHQSQGTGLGLYMTHQMVCGSMGGTIEAYNKNFCFEGREFCGASFSIKFPKDLMPNEK